MSCEIADGSDGMRRGLCLNRAESFPMNTTSKSLVLMNYYRNDLNSHEACRDNSSPLIRKMNMCYKAAGNRWPNYIAVDFYKVYFYCRFKYDFSSYNYNIF